MSHILEYFCKNVGNYDKDVVISIINFLIHSGADVNYKKKRWMCPVKTLVHNTCESSLDVIKIFVENGYKTIDPRFL